MTPRKAARLKVGFGELRLSGDDFSGYRAWRSYCRRCLSSHAV